MWSVHKPVSVLFLSIPSLSAGGCMGACWRHVRHVPEGYTWHPATDRMRGTDVYGVEGGDQAWSIKFDDAVSDQVI